MASQFETIGIIGRVKIPEVKDTLLSLITTLRELKQTIVVEAETAESLNDPNLTLVSREELGARCNLLIVVGGDGSLLHAAHAIVNHRTPVLGINRGRLGFLTDINPSELDKIKNILDGNYTIEKRFLITTKIELNGKTLGSDFALNEIAILPDTIPHMIQFEIYIDDDFVCSQDSDGLIVATPTGSTAYALSGGGPILHPQLDAVVLVPMFPHSLNSRPIVIDGSRRIDVVISPNNTTSPRLSCDGRAYIPTPPNSRISIRKKSRQLHLIHPLDYNYYEALRSKLHWGKKLTYTE